MSCGWPASDPLASSQAFGKVQRWADVGVRVWKTCRRNATHSRAGSEAPGGNPGKPSPGVAPPGESGRAGRVNAPVLPLAPYRGVDTPRSPNPQGVQPL